MPLLTDDQIADLTQYLQQSVDSYDHVNTRLMGIAGLVLLECLSELREINTSLNNMRNEDRATEKASPAQEAKSSPRRGGAKAKAPAKASTMPEVRGDGLPS